MRWVSLFFIFVLCISFALATDVSDCSELQEINNNKLGSYTLLNDIDCSGINFVPIGNNDWENQFKGSIDGNGHVIKNLNINTPSVSYVGFVGYLYDGATISNLGIENATISGSMHTGVMSGHVAGYINNSYVTGTATTTSWNQIGGFAGSVANTGSIHNSYAQVDVTGNDNVGGFVGQNDGSITNSYASGDITANAWASNVGGFIGTGSVADFGNYWDKDISGITTNYGNAVGKTTIQMKQQDTFVGWDFNDIWAIEDGVIPPYLQIFGGVVVPNETNNYDAHLNYYIQHNPDGTYEIVIGDGVTYFDGDEYIPVILDFQPLDYSSTYYPNYQYGMESLKYQAVFKDTANAGQLVTFDSNNLKVTYQPQFIGWINDWDGRENIAQPQDSGFINMNDSFIYPNAYGEGIDLIYDAYANYLKETIAIDSLDRLNHPTPTMLSGGNVKLYVNFLLEFENQGDVLIDGSTWDYSDIVYTQNDILIEDVNGSVSYMIKKPYLIDADGTKYPATYRVEGSAGVNFLMIQIPYDDILNATFPITIDPTTGYNDTTLPNVTLDLSSDIFNPLSKIILYNVTGDGEIIIDTNITAQQDSDNIIYAYAIDPENLDFDSGEADVRNATGNMLLKCVDWNITTDTCGYCNEYENGTCIDSDETWVYADDLVKGNPYDFTFDSVDPAYAEYTSSDGESTTTGTAWVNKLAHTINVPTAGNHLILTSGQATTSSSTYGVYVRSQLDNNLTFMESLHEPKDPSNTRAYKNFFGMTMQNLTAGSHTIDVDFHTENAGIVSYIKNVRANVFSLDEVEYQENLAQQNALETNYTTKSTLTFTPPTQQNYLIMATGEFGDAGTNAVTSYVRMTLDGVEQDSTWIEYKDVTDYITFMFQQVTNLSASSHTIAIQSMTESANTQKVKNLRIVAIPMDAYWDAQYSESLASQVNTATSRLTKTTLTFTPEYSGNYTYLATAEIYTDGVSDAGIVYFTLDGTDRCYMVTETKEVGVSDDGDWIQLMCMYQADLSLASHTATIQWAKIDTPSTYIRNARITAFSTQDNEPPTCSYTGSGVWGFFEYIYCLITTDTTGDGSNIEVGKINTTEFNNVSISGFQNLTIYNSSVVIVNNISTLVVGQ